MIILPNPKICRTKLLMPVPEHEWREPSVSLPRDQLGNPIVQTSFHLTAKTHDGVIIWRGRFDSRDDADAFLFALVTGTLEQQPPLWRLPVPSWPNLDPGLVYNFATQTILTSTTQTSYSRPTDWNNGNNFVEGVGGGGSGADTSLAGCAGGGAGAYAKTTNVSMGASELYKCGVNNTTTTIGSGTSVTCNSWFKDGSTLVAAGAAKGSSGTGTTAGGTTGNSVGGAVEYAGGNGGGGYTNGAAGFGGGGGGAAGPSGAGNNGVSGSGGQVWGNGGDGNAGAAGGGQGSDTASGVGSDGTYWQSSPARGPGGGGAGSTSSLVAGGAGGNYGAGGGGGSAGGGYFVNGGVGKQGLIVVTYTPYKGNISGFMMTCLH